MSGGPTARGCCHGLARPEVAMEPERRERELISHALDLESTSSLLSRIREGDAAARNRLVSRFLPHLQRWARGRLPAGARDLADTDDLVQVTLLRALDRVEAFVPRKEGAFLAYLRRILMNQIRDQIRHKGRQMPVVPLREDQQYLGPSPLEEAIGRETLESYETALAQLTEEQQVAVMLRIEMGFTHQRVAEELGCPSPNAARMVVARALIRLAEAMDEHRGDE